ncbi:expressed unknown protein [Seminavis robusta]|uniref:Uncharacterized protein n=1 Tax=Seminavis robusta TaxID=568900 RepID=A0A9N8DD86_9STRA|nr:expressed unknown protein [Seminavis robusta]|eukprot:Sro41_g025150.1 n/a (278) ;mRNA; f:68463-69296
MSVPPWDRCDHVGAPAFYVERDGGELEVVLGGGERYQIKFLSLSRQCKTYALPIAFEWWYTCKILRGALSKVTRISVFWPSEPSDHLYSPRQMNIMTDAEVFTLIRLFPGLTHLELDGFEDLPKTMRLITSRLCHKLECLRLVGSGGPFKLRRKLIEARPHLRELTLLCQVTPNLRQLLRAGWLPVLDAIGMNPKLAKVVIVKQKWATERTLRFGPRICDALDKHLGGIKLSDINPGNDHWIYALLSLQDRFDCFHYFASQILPTVCVNLVNNGVKR